MSSGSEDALTGELGTHLPRLATWGGTAFGGGHPLIFPGSEKRVALAAGLRVPYSCTVGNCGECMVRMRSGEVTQPEHTCLTPEQKTEGYVLTCVGCPLSKVTLDIADPAVSEGP
ncbi:2Fe-2S iron-sulfur cluster-binding protein [Streptomyces sp. NPDC050509]|uniref:2Fe-2S iron-sulfur cluster-binding protein n=1 Tax=Streptomyces sp. NPDC050509 TaxID=3365620 RepID=UPI0037B8700D